MSLVVVIADAADRVGHAAAREFARQGAKVALLADDRAPLNAVAADVRAAGGHPLAIPADVADYAAVDAAAHAVEAAFGPIDVWVNSSPDVTTSAASQEVSAEDWRRATEAGQLASVHGTMAALERMRAHDHGVVVQLESARAARPAAEPGIGRFVESVRTELRDGRSQVRITTVRMPERSTPLPDIVARTVVFAAEHPERGAHLVGARRTFAARLLPEFDRSEPCLSALTWVALHIQSWASKLENRLGA